MYLEVTTAEEVTVDIGKTKQNVIAVFIFFLLFFLPLLIFSYSNNEYDFPVLKGEFFALTEAAGAFDLKIKDEDAAVKQLLQEAQYIFSSMIYGLKFSYIPQDNARGVSEEFTVKPVYLIPWGDPSLTADNGSFNNKTKRYNAVLRYQVKKEQMPWLQSWETNILIKSGGTGEASLYLGFEGKIEAINNSIKEAIRHYLRQRVYNKPRKITGTVKIAEVPYITINSGKYFCRSKIILRLDEIQEYKHY